MTTQNLQDDIQDLERMVERRMLEVYHAELSRAMEGMSRGRRWVREDSSWENDWDSVPNGTSLTSAALGTRARRAEVTLWENSEGRYYPYYETELDIRRNLRLIRNLFTYDTQMIGVQELLENYTTSGAWSLKWHGSPDMVATVKPLVNSVLDEQDAWATLFPYIRKTSREDGEVLIAFVPHSRLHVDIEIIPPEAIRQPVGVDPLNEWLGSWGATWFFGVHAETQEWSRRPNYRIPLGWFCIWDDAGSDWDYLPSKPLPKLLDDARCGLHVKRNCVHTAARGVSDFYPVLPSAEQSFKIARNVAEGAAIQAAIAMIIQRGSTARSVVLSETIGNTLQKMQAMTGPAQSFTAYARRFDPGTVVEIDNSSAYTTGPMGAPQGQSYLDVAQFMARRIATRWNVPEAFYSSDASNNNYASQLVAESPFTKACEVEQGRQKQVVRSIIWKIIECASAAGMLPAFEAIEAAIEVEIIAPEVASRDIAAQTGRMSTLYDKGIIDREYWAKVEDVPVIDDDIEIAPAPTNESQDGFTTYWQQFRERVRAEHGEEG